MAKPGGDPTARFSSRAEGYARFRPGYPPETLTHLATTCGLSAGSVVAELGEIFATCATAGLVTFEYDTTTYLGRLP